MRRALGGTLKASLAAGLEGRIIVGGRYVTSPGMSSAFTVIADLTVIVVATLRAGMVVGRRQLKASFAATFRGGIMVGARRPMQLAISWAFTIIADLTVVIIAVIVVVAVATTATAATHYGTAASMRLLWCRTNMGA